jgi:hypothetical protein
LLNHGHACSRGPASPIYNHQHRPHLAPAVITEGTWGLFAWWSLYEHLEAQKKRKRVRLAADMAIVHVPEVRPSRIRGADLDPVQDSGPSRICRRRHAREEVR